LDLILGSTNVSQIVLWGDLIAIYIDRKFMYEIDPSDFVRITKFINQKILNENEGTEFSHFFLTSYLNELKGGAITQLIS